MITLGDLREGQELKDAFAGALPYAIFDAYTEAYADGLTDAYNLVCEFLSKPLPEQRWIPCSEETGEGYPKKDGIYYVTEQNYGFYLDADYKQKVAHTSPFKNGDFTGRFYGENHSKIIAYMPLPEPYKAESEVEE